MSDSEGTTAASSEPAAAAATPKGKGKAAKKAATPKTPKVKKPRVKKAGGASADHPKVAVMVNAAIKGLAERGGSSLKAIKKYIHDTYKVSFLIALCIIIMRSTIKCVI